jgi:GTPase SAR1 family protein
MLFIYILWCLLFFVHFSEAAQSQAEALGLTFFEVSAKTNYNVDQAFAALAREIHQRMAASDPRPANNFSVINKFPEKEEKKKKKCTIL